MFDSKLLRNYEDDFPNATVTPAASEQTLIYIARKIMKEILSGGRLEKCPV